MSLESSVQAMRAPTSAASLAAFRIAFGALMVGATMRFAANGWIDLLYVEPSMHLRYWGFEWVPVLPAPALYLVFTLLACSALTLALGLFSRSSAGLFTLLFAYVELIDASTFLNHYYAITLCGLLLSLSPCGAMFSLDARWWPRHRSAQVPAVFVWALRLQLGLVYVFAGIAKLQPDWLVHAEPLRTWLVARADFPVLGPLFAYPQTALAMSWVGAAFDLCVPFALLHPRTRALAYGAVVVFHVLTGALFPIGAFPWVMIALTPIFFAPDWPTRLSRRLGRLADERVEARATAPGWLLTILGIHLCVQLVVPLRHFIIPGDVMLTEEGGRFAWRVMVSERGGFVELRAVDADDRAHTVDLSTMLTLQQERTLAAQPDLLPQVARRIRDDFRARGMDVRVFADAFVSVNGAPSRRIVDPTIDLASAPEPLGHAPWILDENDPHGVARR